MAKVKKLRITTKQKSARRKNIAIARKKKSKGGGSSITLGGALTATRARKYEKAFAKMSSKKKSIFLKAHGRQAIPSKQRKQKMFEKWADSDRASIQLGNRISRGARKYRG